MALKLGSARIDERSKISGGKEGDQTGKEVCTQDYYMHAKGWYVLRPKSVDVANKLAAAMKNACANDKFGYDQTNREAVKMVKKYGSTKAVKEKCETDCGNLVRACIFEASGVDVGEFNTANEAAVLEKSGLFEKKKAVTASTILYNGDVLVTKTKGHTVIVVSGRARKAAKKAITPKKTTTTTKATSYYRKYSGKSDKVDTVLRVVGVPAKYRGSWNKRRIVASRNGISNYAGTLNQNLKLIALAKKGKLKKV